MGIGGWYIIKEKGEVVMKGKVDVIEREVKMMMKGKIVGDILESLSRVI